MAICIAEYECYASSAHNLSPIINHPIRYLQKSELACKYLKLIIHSFCSSNVMVDQVGNFRTILDLDELMGLNMNKNHDDL